MRCSCPECGTYMVHSESHFLGCVCPQCGTRCRNCLGTDSVVPKSDLGMLESMLVVDEEDRLAMQEAKSRLEEMREAARESEGRTK